MICLQCRDVIIVTETGVLTIDFKNPFICIFYRYFFTSSCQLGSKKCIRVIC